MDFTTTTKSTITIHNDELPDDTDLATYGPDIWRYDLDANRSELLPFGEERDELLAEGVEAFHFVGMKMETLT